MSGSLPHLSSLLAQSSLDNHEEVLKVANETLNKDKTDVQAQHTRAVALLKLDRYEDALKTFEDGGDPLKQAGQLEYAYALYKCGRLEDAAKIANSGSAGTSLRHVEAQATYRLEDFARTRELYNELSRPGHMETESDLRINQGATDAQLYWSGRGHLARSKKAEKEDFEQFETAFNTACGYTARGELKQASTLLTRAKDLCNAMDDLTDDEKQAELLPMTVQQIYVHAQLGQLEQAQQLSASLKPADISDLATRHVAQANSLFASPPAQNPFISHRTFHETSQIPHRDRPFSYQSSALQRNALALDLQVGKVPSSTRKSSRAPAASGDASLGVFTAAASARNQTGTAAIKEILPLLERNPSDLGLLLTVVHLYLLTNNTQAAATLLDKFLARLEQSSSSEVDARFAPGLVALQVSLDSALHRGAHTNSELAKATAYWRHKPRSSHNLTPLFTAAALELLDAPTTEEAQQARELFEHLQTIDPNNPSVLAGLAATTSSNDTTFDDSNLPSIASLTTNIDATALEASGIARPPTTTTSQATPNTNKKRPTPTDPTKPQKTKRIRQSLKPKDFDANKKMDPERWLPLRDRSNYRPKGKKKGRGGAGGGGGGMTQGGIASEESSRPGTPGVSAGVVQGKGKKGKGKR